MHLIDRTLGTLAALYTRISQVILAALVLGVLFQVVYRYVFARSLLGLEELTKLGLIWLTFLMAAVLHRKRRHISVTAVYDLLPSAGRRAAEALIGLAIIALALFLFVQMYNVWTFMMLKSPVHRIPDTVYRVAPLFAFVPILLQEVINLWTLAQGRALGDSARSPSGPSR